MKADLYYNTNLWSHSYQILSWPKRAHLWGLHSVQAGTSIYIGLPASPPYPYIHPLTHAQLRKAYYLKLYIHFPVFLTIFYIKHILL